MISLLLRVLVPGVFAVLLACGGRADLNTQFTRHEGACDDGDHHACGLLADLYRDGRGVEKSLYQAVGLYRRACAAGDTGSCVVLGRMHEQIGGRSKEDKDYLEPRRLYRRACAGGDALGCARLADLYQSGRGGEKDPHEAARLYRSACERGAPEGCGGLSRMLTPGGSRRVLNRHIKVRKPLKADPKEAQRLTRRELRLYERSCRQGNVESCRHLGALYSGSSKHRSLKKDLNRAAEYYETGCEKGDAQSCGKLFSNLGRERVVAQNPERAVRLYQAACQDVTPRNADHCTWLAAVYLKGDGVAAAPAKAWITYRKACEADAARRCDHQAMVARLKTAPTKAPGSSALDALVQSPEVTRMARKRCEWSWGGGPVGCGKKALKRVLAQSSSEHTVTQLLTKACTAGDAAGCFSLSGIEDAAKRQAMMTPENIALAEEACDGGHVRSCRLLGDGHLHGRLAPQNELTAADWYGKACRGGDYGACNTLSRVYLSGRRVPRELKAALRLLAITCTSGEFKGCIWLGLALEKGEGDSDKYPHPARLYEDVCTGLSRRAQSSERILACYHLGRMYEAGNGLPRDIEKARKAYEISCPGQAVYRPRKLPKACEALKRLEGQ